MALWNKSAEYLAYQWYLALGGTPGIATQATWAKSLEYWLWQIAVLYGETATNWHMPIEYWLYRIYVLNGGTATNHHKPAEYWARLIYGQLTATSPIANMSLEYWLYEISQNATPPFTPWWLIAGYTPLAAYQPRGAASQAISYENIDNPGTNDAVPMVAPTWSMANGWALDGLTQWLDSGIIPADDQSYSLFVRYANSTGSSGCLTGMFSVNPASRAMQIWWDAGPGVIYANGQFALVGASLAAGILAVAGNQGYRNGVADGPALGAWSGPAMHALAIGARNANGAADTFYAGNIHAWAVYANPFNAAEVLATVTAMAL